MLADFFASDSEELELDQELDQADDNDEHQENGRRLRGGASVAVPPPSATIAAPAPSDRVASGVGTRHA